MEKGKLTFELKLFYYNMNNAEFYFSLSITRILFKDHQKYDNVHLHVMYIFFSDLEANIV